MTYKEAEAERNRKDLVEFIRKKVIGDNFDLDDLSNLRTFVDNEEENGEPETAFCDWFDLGDWFRNAMIQCDFDVEGFIDDLDADMQVAAKEAAQDRADLEDDYLRMVGAK